MGMTLTQETDGIHDGTGTTEFETAYQHSFLPSALAPWLGGTVELQGGLRPQ